MKLSVRFVALGVALALAACGGDGVTTTVPATTGPSTTATTAPTTTAITTTTISPTTTTTTTTTTTSPSAGPATEPFSITAGEDGVTYDRTGSPPSGPAAFVVLADGSVVVADTMAVRDGNPRLLRYDATGTPLGPVALADAEVYSIVDVATDGSRMVVLDLFLAMNRYRLVFLAPDGAVDAILTIPDGYWLEDGLTGVVWDDDGVLLQMEWGSRYARLTPSGGFEPTPTVTVRGAPLTLTPGAGLTTTVDVGGATFEVPRTAELGGASLIGVAPDGTILLVVDEVVTGDDGAFEVTRRVRRYTTAGELLAEASFVAGGQYLMIERELELTADGHVARMVSFEDHVEIQILDI